VLAKYLFNHADSLVKIDMSEYGERFSVSRLIGAPPGYVGYEEGGELTERIRRNPYSVILFDEIEKAHPDIFNVLLQLFDEGILTDGLGRKVDFKNAIIIMTSNLATKEIQGGGTYGFIENSADNNYQGIKERVLDQVKTTFNPEFLNRIDETVVFHPLSEKDVLEIIDLQLNDLMENLDKKSIHLTITKKAKQLVLKKGYSVEYGVRRLRREIQSLLEDPLSEKLLERTFLDGDAIKVDVKKSEMTFSNVKRKPSSKSSRPVLKRNPKTKTTKI